jgi:transcription elongation factor SPT6
VLALKLHPQQTALPEEERLAVVERVLSTAVAQVGVDLNAVAATAWLQAPLQFVPG